MESKKTCPQCGYAVDSGAVRCPRCFKLLLQPCSGNCSKCPSKGHCA